MVEQEEDVLVFGDEEIPEFIAEYERFLSPCFS